MQQEKKKTGLFFGSFNPLHAGHMIIANYMAEFTDLEQVWFIVSPLNPLKEKSTLLADHHRYYMVQLAVEDEARFMVNDIEFHLPKPSYTIETLVRLEEKYPSRKFILISGTDIFPTFHKWKNYKVLLENYAFYIYNRPGFDLGKYEGNPNLHLFKTPLMEISSSFIREAIRLKKNVSWMLPPKVWDHICAMHFYEKL